MSVVNNDLPDFNDIKIPKNAGSAGKQVKGSGETIESSVGTGPAGDFDTGPPSDAKKNPIHRLITRGTLKKPEIDLEQQGAKRVAKMEAERGGTIKEAEANPATATSDPEKGGEVTHVQQDPIKGLNPEKVEGVTKANPEKALKDEAMPVEHAGPNK